MNKIHITCHRSSIGELILGSFDGKLCLLDYRYRKRRQAIDKRIQQALNAEFIEHEHELLQQAITQLEEYLHARRKEFDLPLLMIGTNFQKAVWQTLVKIPYGSTMSYLELATSIGNHKAVRAVATANGANALAIVVPCHRVIGHNGELVGYAGGVPTKQRLLELEHGRNSPKHTQMSRTSRAQSLYCRYSEQACWVDACAA